MKLKIIDKKTKKEDAYIEVKSKAEALQFKKYFGKARYTYSLNKEKI